MSFLKAETFERGQYIIKEGEVPVVCGCTENNGKPWKNLGNQWQRMVEHGSATEFSREDASFGFVSA